jgi:hypothetical protein
MGSRRDELVAKLSALVRSRFGGDYARAFRHYAPGGLMYEDQLIRVLTDAGVDGWLKRSIYARGMLAALDANRDGAIDWGEFKAAVM